MISRLWRTPPTPAAIEAHESTYAAVSREREAQRAVPHPSDHADMLRARVEADREAEAIRSVPWDEFLRRSARIQGRR